MNVPIMSYINVSNMNVPKAKSLMYVSKYTLNPSMNFF